MTVDGNFAASNIAYMFNDCAFVYPITPSSPMAENCDQFVFEKRKNIFGNILLLSQMQSESGVAGAVHGALLAGEKTTTFTSSQGLLLMLPNMYKIAGEGYPCVFYVSARTVATHALSIFCDYSDVYACLKTGFNIVNCSSVQEVNDMTIACELASVKSNIPYICFFDGFRTSHELSTINVTELEDIKKIINPAYYSEFKNRGMNNSSPFVSGTNQNPDVFMQNRLASLKKYASALDDFSWALKKQQEITGRSYDTIEYYGDKNAKSVVVSMGASADVLRLAQIQSKEKVGIIKVRMLKPFDAKMFVSLLPKNLKNISVLERNLDVNGIDCLTSFVASALQKYKIKAKVFSGAFGLGGKEFTPDMALAVFKNMQEKRKEFFTLGVFDDVSQSSLEVKETLKDNIAEFSMRVYGLGSDGSVSSVKNTIKILGDNTDFYMQGYFDYDSKKSGSLTVSHLRAGRHPIIAPFNPTHVNLMMCNNQGYIEKYDITECVDKNGTVIFNTNYDAQTLNKIMPTKMKKDIRMKNLKVFVIDANKIANSVGLGQKINTIMQTAMFKVCGLMPFEKALESIKDFIKKSYSAKGEKAVESNLKAVENVENEIKEIDCSVFEINSVPCCKVEQSEYYENIIVPTSNQEGDQIPVSKFEISGRMPTDTAKFEKRALPSELPSWIAEKCIQCGRCSVMCPHSALRPLIIAKNKKLPKSFETAKAFGCDGKYRMQINTFNCTGCGVCSTVCPVKAILMTESEKLKDKEIANMAFSSTIEESKPFNTSSTKGIQFLRPYFEHSGACAGCGETAYIRLVTQLFGDRMLVANATGCSSIYSGSFPTCPYSKDKMGFGPSWANSLFEDNAEFGFGIALARKNQRKNFINSLKNMKFSRKMNEFLKDFEKNPENHENNKQVVINLNQYKKEHIIKGDDNYVYDNINLIVSPSIWIVGGDGWAYDIGFGGLDHIVSTGENVNILILDTEVYSNTGGQTSKSTPRGATAKFNLTGKTTKKKDLASMLMTYKDVYVAQVCLGANPDQTVKAFVEAAQYNGPSVIIAYSPCINHGYDMKYSQVHAFNSVKSGYNTLFRYNPTAEQPMQIDSFEPTMNYDDFVMSENRFAILKKVNLMQEKELLEKSENDAKNRRLNLKSKTLKDDNDNSK